VVGIVTALSMVEQADARKKIIINRDSVTASANGGDGASGTSSGADGADGGDGGVAVATIGQ
jgi:hypothetical protein